ncbi:AAA family ATPase [Bacillus paranthracis]
MKSLEVKKDLIIIDEIESHLQPGLVRLLINLIRNHGESQYIIATHSAPVMETAKGEDILYRFNKKRWHV